MLSMAYILILGEIDISVGATVCLSATMTCMACNKNLPFIMVVIVALLVWYSLRIHQRNDSYKVYRTSSDDCNSGYSDHLQRNCRISLGSGGSISLSNADGFRMIAGKVGMIPYILFVVIIFAVIFTLILSKTTFGRSVY